MKRTLAWAAAILVVPGAAYLDLASDGDGALPSASSALVGMFFGVDPARRRPRLDPVEVRRHE